MADSPEILLTAGQAAKSLGLSKRHLILLTHTFLADREGAEWPMHIGEGQGVWIAPAHIWWQIAAPVAHVPSKGGRPRKGVGA